MKITLLSAFYPYRGGIAQFGAMLYRALETKHEVEAITFTTQYPNMLFPGTSQFVTENDQADPIPAVRLLSSVQPFSFAKTANHIQKSEPDVVISQYWMPFFGPALGGVHKRLKGKTKRISILHNVIPHEKRFFDAAANRYFLKHNDGFVVMSDVVLQDLLSLKPDAKYLRIDHPVYDQFGQRIDREEALGKLGLDPANNYLLFFGFIRDYKGLDILLDSLKILPETYHVIVAGEVYGSFDKYTEQIKRLALEDRVHLYNEYIADDAVSTYFSAADVCMLTYKSATQSGITAISYHFDLPIIATDVGGLKEKTKHLETGLIVSKPEAKPISEAVLLYFGQNLKPEMQQKIGIEKAEHNWVNFADKLVEFAETLSEN